MTVPPEYRTASRNFERFLDEVRQQAMLATHNLSYAMTRAVLHVFRDHLPVQDAIDFANLLPPLLRSIFVENWHLVENPPAFGARAVLTREVLAVREAHNSSPDSAIGDVAAVLRRHVDVRAFDRLLARLPHGAAEYWAVP